MASGQKVPGWQLRTLLLVAVFCLLTSGETSFSPLKKAQQRATLHQLCRKRTFLFVIGLCLLQEKHENSVKIFQVPNWAWVVINNCL